MAFQTPPEVAGDVAGVLIISFAGVIAGSLLVWLVWVHKEPTSYVAFVAYSTLLPAIASVIQQLHVYICYEDVVRAQHAHALANIGDPELVISNGSVGMDLVLFYIQYCCYNISAMFVLFWGFTLTQSVYGWSDKPKLRRPLRIINVSGKVISVLVPILLISLLQLESLESSFIGFLLMADMPLILSLFGGCAFVIAILIRYIYSRRKFLTWSVQYGKESHASSTGARNSVISKNTGRQSSIYDRWLIVRFSIGFAALGVFEVTNVLFQLQGRANMTRDAIAKDPDFSVERARSTVWFFIPGILPSLLSFFVFGTTAPFRRRMYDTFIPRCFRRDRRRTAGVSMPTLADRVPQSETFALQKRGHSVSITGSQQPLGYGHQPGAGITRTDTYGYNMQYGGGASAPQSRRGMEDGDSDDAWPILQTNISSHAMSKV